MAKMTLFSNRDTKPQTDNIGGDAIAEIRQAIIDNKIRASGRTQASLGFEDTLNHLVIYGDGSGAPLSTLQWGRPAGKVPSGFNGIIKQWILDKGISVRIVPYLTDRPHKYSVEERSLNLAAGAIATMIAKKGTKRHSEPNEIIYTPAINKAIERFKERAATYMKEAIIKELMK